MFKLIRKTLAVLGAAALLTTGAWADKAVIVGVDKYPGIPGNDLNGCINDAQAMVNILKDQGFQVTFIENAKRAEILQALSTAASSTSASEKFVFYYSGHGSTIGDDGVILPSDTRPDGGNTISADELNKAVRAVPAAGRSIILDSCFSGAMSRALLRPGRPGEFRSRFVALPNAPATRSFKVNDQSQHRGTKDVYYFTAARNNEYALETRLGGKPRGVFTYHLESVLRGHNGPWQPVQRVVSSKVPETTYDDQHPTYTEGYEGIPVYAGPNAPPPPPPPSNQQTSNLWETFNSDYVDSAKLRLSMEPDKTPIKVGELIKFRANAGMDGYLVLIERGTSGKINLLFPHTSDVEAARVSSGFSLMIPDPKVGEGFAPDSPGTERLKAILFRDRDAAAKLISQFEAARSLSYEAASRDFQLVPVSAPPPPPPPTSTSVPDYPYYTSDVQVAVER